MEDERYPLMARAAQELRAASGRPVETITLEALAAGELTDDDLRITPEALRAQAAIAEQAGFGQLAANLRRAAELTAVPNAELLRMYETLRPGRASYEEIFALADRLEREFDAHETAAFVREAAEVYRMRGLGNG
ncbi:MAG: diol dehydratase small subunit [Anaerolineae bacterium]